MKKKLYIDQGHNFNQFGTGASGNGMREQDVTFHVGYLLKQLLQNDFDVMLSRETLETNLGYNNATSESFCQGGMKFYFQKKDKLV